MKTTPVRIRKETAELLKKLKIHPRETYDDVLNRLINFFKTPTLELNKRGG